MDVVHLEGAREIEQLKEENDETTQTARRYGSFERTDIQFFGSQIEKVPGFGSATRKSVSFQLDTNRLSFKPLARYYTGHKAFLFLGEGYCKFGTGAELGMHRYFGVVQG